MLTSYNPIPNTQIKIIQPVISLSFSWACNWELVDMKESECNVGFMLVEGYIFPP